MEDAKPQVPSEVLPSNNGSDEIASSSSNGVIKRIHLPEDEKVEKEKFLELWHDQNRYIDQLETKLKMANQPDASRREHLLIVRLTTKEQELQELSNQIAELKASQAPSTAAMRNALLDPAVNLIVQKLKKELETARSKLQETQEELSAWKFTPDSVSGKRLMQRCRQLLAENEEAGKMISSGRIAKLEGELSMQKALCEEMKKNQIEMDDFVQELDDDMEGMQNTIYFLQQQLKEAKETISKLEAQKSGTDLSYPDGNSEMQDDRLSLNDEYSNDRETNMPVSDRDYTKQGNSQKSITMDVQNDDDKSIDEFSSSITDQKDSIIHIPLDDNNKEESEIDNSFHEDSVEDKNLETDQTSMEETSETSASVPRSRGKRGTPTKLEKIDQQKGRRSQRATRGQKRGATNSADDEKSEKEDGVNTRPKRTRAIPREEQEI